MGADYRKTSYSIYAGNSNATLPANTEQVYAPNGGDPAGIANANFRDVPICRVGTLQHLYCHSRVAPGVGETYDYEIYLNGVLTALVVEIAGAVDQNGNNVADGIGVVPGDLIRVHVTSSLGANGTLHSWSFELV